MARVEETLRLRTTADMENSRLDVVVLNHLAADPDYAYVTRSQIKQWIEEGRVLVGGARARKAGQSLKSSQEISIAVPPPSLPEVEPVEMPLDIVHEDESLLVLNKPAGLSMHPGAGAAEPTLLNGVCWYLRERVPVAASCTLVHRLDKDTTGVVLIAKTPEAQLALTRQFAERSVEKQYLALVYTTPRARRAVQLEPRGTISAQLGRHPRKRTEMAVVVSGGREAVTDWERLEELRHATLLAVRPKTGRTHQIRVHMTHLGSPIIGDRTYGDTSALPVELRRAAERFGRQALHASSLRCRHPVSGVALEFRAPPPPDFAELLDLFRSFSE